MIDVALPILVGVLFLACIPLAGQLASAASDAWHRR